MRDCVGEGGRAESGEKVVVWEKRRAVKDRKGNIRIRVLNFKWALGPFLKLKWAFPFQVVGLFLMNRFLFHFFSFFF